MSDNEYDKPTPVHCDASVLHAPGECGFCDTYGAHWQAYRIMAGINFTGHYDDDKSMCPSEMKRPLEKVHTWHGNKPQPVIRCDQCGALPGECVNDAGEPIGSCYRTIMERLTNNEPDPHGGCPDGGCGPDCPARLGTVEYSSDYPLEFGLVTCKKAPRGWWCSRDHLHPGPCALRPKWWNVLGLWMSR